MKTLIIKTGAAGDVVRTTTLLNVLEGPITWIADRKNQSLFPDNLPSFKCVSLESAKADLVNEEFELVLSLEEDKECARLASKLKAKNKIGIYEEDGKLKYTEQSRGWFDMSLCSSKGREEANRLKKQNRLPFQHWLFEMIGKTFTNEPYRVYHNQAITNNSELIGIEKRIGDVWPNKAWRGYDELAEKLGRDGFKIKIFEQRASLRDYMDDIASCSCVISGDTLAMHLALAYHIPCIAVFNCTSPAEIHPYDTLKKIVSPLLNENFYSRVFSKEVIESVPVSNVYNAFKHLHLVK